MHTLPYVCWSPPTLGAHIKPIPLFSLSCYPFPTSQAVTCPLFSYWLPDPHLILTFSKSSANTLPRYTCSLISNWFLAHSLLIALMMEAARTSETLVNLYQSTWHYNPEDSHLRFNCFYQCITIYKKFISILIFFSKTVLHAANTDCIKNYNTYLNHFNMKYIEQYMRI
jgi:hypothetical protein